METPLSFKERLASISANIVLVWFLILLYTENHYYKTLLLPQTAGLLFWAAVIYSLWLLGVLLIGGPQSKSKGLFILTTLSRFGKEFFAYTRSLGKDGEKPLPTLSHQEKTALLFLLVKIFFLPLMLNFMIGNLSTFYMYYSRLSLAELPSSKYFIAVSYPLLLNLIFLIDTLIFTFGYLIESKFLGNEVRSVEPTVLGWAVALICYPPFTDLGNNYFNWYTNDYVTLPNESLTLLFYAVILVCFLIYLWATFSLGAKSSNLTNRGIVTYGPYALIRHPHYASKNLAWWLSILPIFSIGAFLSMLAWSFIYYLRAITEERHLLADPEYRAYAKEVPYRFIPGVW